MSDLPRETPDLDAVKAAFGAWVRRTNTRFAPYMGSVDEAFAEWQRCYPEEVAAALAKAPVL